MYDNIKAGLEDEIERLEDTRSDVDIEATLWLERNLKQPKGRAPPKPKPVITTGPCIVHMLKESEIIEDWTKIKKMLLTAKRKENDNQRYQPY